MVAMNLKYHRTLANYFKEQILFFDGDSQKKPHIRKLVEQPWQQTRSALIETKIDLWNLVTETLCDLYFIEAKCIGGLIFNLIDDYHFALDNIPERQVQVAEEKHQKERTDQWIHEVTEYSKKWSEYRNQLNFKGKVNKAKPCIPEFPPLCKMWTQEDIDQECKKTIDNQSRLNRLIAFEIFITSQCYVIIKYIHYPGFVAQLTFNCEAAGPVHDAAAGIVKRQKTASLQRHWLNKSSYNPMPALIRTLTGAEASCVCITANGQYGITGMGRSIRIWDLRNGRCLNTLTEHTSEVSCLSITPDGQWAVSGSKDETVRVWDLIRGKCIYTFSSLGDYARNVCIAMDGKRAVVGSRMKKELCTWNLEDGQYINALEGHTEVITHLSSTPDGRWLISGSRDKTLLFWDMGNNQCLHILKGHNDTISCTCITPDAHFAVSASEDNTLRVWDLKSGSCIRLIEKATDNIQLLITRSAFNVNFQSGNTSKSYVTALCVSSDGQYAVTATENDSNIRVWDLKSGLCLRTLEGHTAGVSCVVIMSDGHNVVSGSKDGTIKVWEPLGAHCIQTLEGHISKVNSLCVSGNGVHIISGSEDRTIRVWDWHSGHCLHVLEGHTESITSVNITPALHRIVSISEDQSMKIWDTESGKCLRTIEGHTNSVTCLSLTPDGKKLVTGSDHSIGAGIDDSLRIWDLEEGRCLQILKGFYTTRGITTIFVTPDGQYALVGEKGSSKLQIWDLNSFKRLQILEIPHAASILGSKDLLCVSSGNQKVVAGYADSKLRVWDVNSGECLMELEGHTGPVNSVSLTPDGRRAVSGGGYDRTLRVWDLETGQCLRILEGHTGEVTSVSMRPDGRWVVSSSNDGTLRVWNIENGQCPQKPDYHIHGIANIIDNITYPVLTSIDKTLQILDMDSGKCLRNLAGHTDMITEVIMTPDGRRVVSASLDNTLRVWDLKSGKCLHRLIGHTDEIIKVLLMPDGKSVASVSKDKSFKMWNLDNGKCIRTKNLPDYCPDYERDWGLTSDGLYAIWINGDNFWGRDIEKGRSYLLKGHTGLADSFSISPNGHHVISTASVDLKNLKLDLTMRLWNLENGQCIRVIEGHSEFFAVKVLGNGNLAVSVSNDNKLRMWDLNNGQCIQTITGLSENTTNLYLSPDEQLIISTNPFSVWNLAQKEFMTFFHASAPVKSIHISHSSAFFVAKTTIGEEIILKLNIPDRDVPVSEDKKLVNVNSPKKSWWKFG
jgi:WD40 repeat protein